MKPDDPVCCRGVALQEFDVLDPFPTCLDVVGLEELLFGPLEGVPVLVVVLVFGFVLGGLGGVADLEVGVSGCRVDSQGLCGVWGLAADCVDSDCRFFHGTQRSWWMDSRFSP